MVPLIREGGEDQLLLISKALESERPEHWANDTCVVLTITQAIWTPISLSVKWDKQHLS